MFLISGVLQMIPHVSRFSGPFRAFASAVTLLVLGGLAGRVCYGVYAADSLRQAAGEGQAAQVAYWLNRGADVNARDRFGDTPLMYAARNAHPFVAQTLLARGANPRLRDNFGLSAARWAVFHLRDSQALRCVNGIEIRQVPRPDALQTIALLAR